MSADERERFLVRVNDSLSDPRDLMSEGRPHKKAKTRVVDLLGLHFRAMGRVVYVAEEMGVVYPGEPAFAPDVLAVVDVEQPEDDERMAWVVADEKRGIDLAFEVLHRGDRDKDLVENVARYARLGIPEYFVYDRARQHIHGYRLPDPNPGRYERIVPQAGRHHSVVLGLDLAIQGGTLRFFQGMAELFGTDDLVGRLNEMVQSLTAKADEAETKAQQAETKAQQAETRAGAAVRAMQGAIVTGLEARGIACGAELHAKIATCEDPATLQRWLLRAMTARSAADVE